MSNSRFPIWCASWVNRSPGSPAICGCWSRPASERHQEGNGRGIACETSSGARNAELARQLIDLIPEDDDVQSLDLIRLEEIKAERARTAADYFRSNAASWSEVRALHVDPAKVDAALRQVVLRKPIENLLDIGTGTGRVLELVAPEGTSAIGIDLSREMLAVARHNLTRTAAHCGPPATCTSCRARKRFRRS